MGRINRPVYFSDEHRYLAAYAANRVLTKYNGRGYVTKSDLVHVGMLSLRFRSADQLRGCYERLCLNITTYLFNQLYGLSLFLRNKSVDENGEPRNIRIERLSSESLSHFRSEAAPETHQPLVALASKEESQGCHDVCANLLSILDDRSKYIIQRLYGIGMEQVTIKVVCAELGRSRNRIYQLRKAAIKKMKKAMDKTVKDTAKIACGVE
jgi:hypothetical protein